jgi:hypothetical protein
MTVVLLQTIAALALAQPAPKTEKGEVKVGSHTVKMETGSIYRIRVEGDGFRPVVNVRPFGNFVRQTTGGERDV